MQPRDVDKNRSYKESEKFFVTHCNGSSRVIHMQISKIINELLLEKLSILLHESLKFEPAIKNEVEKSFIVKSKNGISLTSEV